MPIEIIEREWKIFHFLHSFFCDFLLLLYFGRLLVLKDKEKKPPKVLPSVGTLLGAFVIESTNKVPNLHPFTYL